MKNIGHQIIWKKFYNLIIYMRKIDISYYKELDNLNREYNRNWVWYMVLDCKWVLLWYRTTINKWEYYIKDNRCILSKNFYDFLLDTNIDIKDVL
jgi:hypothetical protein